MYGVERTVVTSADLSFAEVSGVKRTIFANELADAIGDEFSLLAPPFPPPLPPPPPPPPLPPSPPPLSPSSPPLPPLSPPHLPPSSPPPLPPSSPPPPLLPPPLPPPPPPLPPLPSQTEWLPSVMSTRLHREQVARHVEALRSQAVLTALRSGPRLETIVGTMADDGRFLLRDVLVAAEFPEDDTRGQDAFQDFRKRVNQAATKADIELALELDSRKAPPDQRHGWFTGSDLVDDGIASFTSATARRTGVEHPVDQAVTELGKSRRTRLYVSFPEGAARKVGTLLRQLREVLALDTTRSWEVADATSVGLGEDVEAVRDRLCAQADVRVALVSSAYLASGSRERDRVLSSAGRVVAFALSGLPDGYRPWARCPSMTSGTGRSPGTS